MRHSENDYGNGSGKVWRGWDAAGTNAHHVSPSISRKALFMQVNTQDYIADDVGTGGATNPQAFAAFNTAEAMQKVAQFYSDPARGAGIDLYWVTSFFIPWPGSPIDYGNGDGRPSAYRYEGLMNYAAQGQIPTDVTGGTLITADLKYLRLVGANNYWQVFPRREGVLKRCLRINRDPLLRGFCLLLFMSRKSTVTEIGNVHPFFPAALAVTDSRRDENGAFVFPVQMSEENPILYSGAPYSPAQFKEYLWWSTAHEIAHLLLGDGHSPDNTGTLMSTRVFLSNCVVSPEELSRMDVKNKLGVTK